MSSSDLSPTRRWRLDLAYDGAPFRGFAPQPGRETVVGALGEALRRALRLDVAPTIVGAGRTDAGVHARAQVVHADLPWPLFADDRGDDVTRLVASLNGQLGHRIIVTAATPVSSSFDARRSATWRAYRYLVVESASPPLTLVSAVAWVVPGPFEVAALETATAALAGTHDFRSFCRRRPAASPEDPIFREVRSATWRVVTDELTLSAPTDHVWRFDIVATSFCHQMVRAIVACLVDVARGRAPVSVVATRFAEPSREGMAPPAPAAGLMLVGVGYD